MEAIKNIKIDKITVWDGGAQTEMAKPATAGFVSGLMKSIPPMNELFDMAGMNLPEFLGTDKEKAEQAKAAQAASGEPAPSEAPSQQ